MNVYLIGYRGTGKTTVGKQLAQRLGWEWIDTDERIVNQAGKSVREIFAEEGEAAFRQKEREVVSEMAATNHRVVSLGGGAVLDPTSRAVLRRSGHCIWLSASVDEICQRLGASRLGDDRPPLTDLPLRSEIETVLDRRQSIYEGCADCTIETGGLNVDQVVVAIEQWLQSVDR